MQEIRENFSTGIVWHECCANEKSVNANKEKSMNLFIIFFFFTQTVCALCNRRRLLARARVNVYENTIDSSAAIQMQLHTEFVLMKIVNNCNGWVWHMAHTQCVCV